MVEHKKSINACYCFTTILKASKQNKHKYRMTVDSTTIQSCINTCIHTIMKRSYKQDKEYSMNIIPLYIAHQVL